VEVFIVLVDERCGKECKKEEGKGKCSKGIRKMNVGVKNGDKKAGMGQKRPNLHMK
jgi:hypothetical protein